MSLARTGVFQILVRTFESWTFVSLLTMSVASTSAKARHDVLSVSGGSRRRSSGLFIAKMAVPSVHQFALGVFNAGLLGMCYALRFARSVFWQSAV